jgi:hypothetical protein
MKRRTFALSMAAALAGCASLGVPDRLTLSQAELNERLAQRFPQERRWLELFDLRIARPVVTLLPATNRLGTLLDLEAAERLFGRRFGGRVTLDYALRYDAPSRSLRMAQVRVWRVELEGWPEAAAPGRLGAWLAEQFFEDLPLHEFRADDLQRIAAAGRRPGAVTVTSRGLEIALEPVP